MNIYSGRESPTAHDPASTDPQATSAPARPSPRRRAPAAGLRRRGPGDRRRSCLRRDPRAGRGRRTGCSRAGRPRHGACSQRPGAAPGGLLLDRPAGVCRRPALPARPRRAGRHPADRPGGDGAGRAGPAARRASRRAPAGAGDRRAARRLPALRPDGQPAPAPRCRGLGRAAADAGHRRPAHPFRGAHALGRGGRALGAAGSQGARPSRLRSHPAAPARRARGRSLAAGLEPGGARLP